VIHKIGVAVCIVFTVYGQVAAKLATRSTGALPPDTPGRLAYMGRLLLNPFFLSSFAAAVVAALGWMIALSGIQLSRAYPFMSLNFVLVLLLSAPLFAEPITIRKAAGVALIIAGVILGSRA
jgi:multidrug transporter EmrE-like cation transporter